jgi:hypothetical protein
MAMSRVEHSSAREFNVFKTIKLGTGPKTGLEFVLALAQVSEVGLWVDDMIEGQAFTTSETEVEIDLVALSPRDLGLTGRTVSLLVFYNAAKAQGLELCPAEVGPQLRLQYTDQPQGESLHVAMEPIPDGDGDPNIFEVSRDRKGLCFDASFGDDETYAGEYQKYLFVQPRR